MKKYIVVLILACITYQSNAQVLISLLFGDKLNSDKIEFGLEGGANFSHITSLRSTKLLPTFNLGLYFDIELKKNWRLYTGVLVKSNLGTNHLAPADLAQLNATIYNASGDYSQKIGYFMVPVLAKYQFKNRFYLEAGPQAGLRNSGWIEFNSDSSNTTAKIKQKNADDICRFDFGMVGGLGFKIQKTHGMTIGLKYYYGFVDVYKHVDGNNNNSALFIKVNVPIGAGKKKHQESAPVNQ